MRDDDDEDRSSMAVFRFRIQELEKRQGRMESLVLGFLLTVALAFLGGVFTLLKLPTP